MSKTIAEILRHYPEIQSSNPGSELSHIKTDIQRALENVPLTLEERGILRTLFFVSPIAPQRDRVNHSGGTSGRPAGGITQSLIAGLLIETQKSDNAKNIILSRKLKVITDKLAAYLGPEYQDAEGR